MFLLSKKDMFLWKVEEYKYPCRHAMAYFRIWEDMSFPGILQQHVHDYYRTKEWNRYMDTTFSQLYKIRSDMMETHIHQHWGHGNLDDPKQNNNTSIAISSIMMSPQLSALSVEREDVIEGHAQMLWHDLSLSYCKCFLLFFIVFLLLFRIMFDC